MVNWNDPFLIHLIEDTKQKRTEGVQIFLKDLQAKILKHTGEKVAQSTLSKRLTAEQVRATRGRPPKLPSLEYEKQIEVDEDDEGAEIDVESVNVLRGGKRKAYPEIISEVCLSKFLEETILTLSEAAKPGYVRQYRFQFMAGSEKRYLCSKCEFFNYQEKSKQDKAYAQVSVVNRELLLRRFTKHHDKCEPILLQKALAQQVDRECRLTIRNGQKDLRFAWQQGYNKCTVLGMKYGFADRGPNSVASHFPQYNEIKSRYTVLRQQSGMSKFARRALPKQRLLESSSCEFQVENYDDSSRYQDDDSTGNDYAFPPELAAEIQEPAFKSSPGPDPQMDFQDIALMELQSLQRLLQMNSVPLGRQDAYWSHLEALRRLHE